MGRCPATTTRRCWPPGSSSAWPPPGRSASPRSWPRFLDAAADALGDDVGTVLRRLASGRLDGRAADQALDALCDPMYARALKALIRDTLSPDIIHAGVKYNVIPGDAVIEVDCRVLPGMDEPDARRLIEERIGPTCCRPARSRSSSGAPRSRPPADGRCGTSSSATLRDHDPDACRCR